MHRDIQKILLTEKQIQDRIAELGKELSEEYAGKNPLVVGVLKGVVIFYADMVRQLTVPCQMDFMCISSYAGTESTGKMVVKKDISADVKGRHVLILEDILDSGRTLKAIVEMLKDRKPASVKICTLFDKPEGRKIPLTADYVCYDVPNEFVVGFGLDYNEYYRNLPYVGVLKPSVYQD